MSGHNILQESFVAGHEIPDPGNGGAIVVDRDHAVCSLKSGASAETRTLAAPTRAGLTLTLSMDTDGGGDITVTVASAVNQSSHTSLPFGDAGDYVALRSLKIGTAYYWRIVAYEGVTSA